MKLSHIFQITLLLAILSLTSATAPADSYRTPSSITTVAPAEKPPTLLADEVIRRLRRLGLNFVKNRIAHPYDPFGELC